MKFLEKFSLIVFSNIILILSIILSLLIFGWIDPDFAGGIFMRLILGETSSKILLGVNLVFILLAIKCIFFDGSSKEELNDKQGVLLENENGKLMISKETIENLVNSVALNFPSAENVSTRVELDKENNVRVFVNLVISSDAIIKNLSANLQTKIKEKIKVATDLDVLEVNIMVKKVADKKEQEA